jgi:anti-sigma B factor antagonist
MSVPIDRPRLLVERTEDSIRVRLTGCEVLDEATLPVLREQLFALISEPGSHRMLFDLSGVRFLSSTGLGLMVALHKRLRDAGGSLTLFRLEGTVREVFEVTRLTRILDILPEEPPTAEATV